MLLPRFLVSWLIGGGCRPCRGAWVTILSTRAVVLGKRKFVRCTACAWFIQESHCAISASCRLTAEAQVYLVLSARSLEAPCCAPVQSPNTRASQCCCRKRLARQVAKVKYDLQSQLSQRRTVQQASLRSMTDLLFWSAGRSCRGRFEDIETVQTLESCCHSTPSRTRLSGSQDARVGLILLAEV